MSGSLLVVLDRRKKRGAHLFSGPEWIVTCSRGGVNDAGHYLLSGSSLIRPWVKCMRLTGRQGGLPRACAKQDCAAQCFGRNFSGSCDPASPRKPVICLSWQIPLDVYVHWAALSCFAQAQGGRRWRPRPSHAMDPVICTLRKTSK